MNSATWKTIIWYNQKINNTKYRKENHIVGRNVELIVERWTFALEIVENIIGDEKNINSNGNSENI